VLLSTIKDGRSAVATLPALRHSWQLPFPYIMVVSLIARIGMLFYAIRLGALSAGDFHLIEVYDTGLSWAFVYPLTHVFYIIVMVTTYEALFRTSEKLIEPLLDRRTGLHLVHLMSKNDRDIKSYMIASTLYDELTPSSSRTTRPTGDNSPRPTGDDSPRAENRPIFKDPDWDPVAY